MMFKLLFRGVPARKIPLLALALKFHLLHCWLRQWLQTTWSTQ